MNPIVRTVRCSDLLDNLSENASFPEFQRPFMRPSINIHTCWGLFTTNCQQVDRKTPYYNIIVELVRDVDLIYRHIRMWARICVFVEYIYIYIIFHETSRVKCPEINHMGEAVTIVPIISVAGHWTHGDNYLVSLVF